MNGLSRISYRHLESRPDRGQTSPPPPPSTPFYYLEGQQGSTPRSASPTDIQGGETIFSTKTNTDSLARLISQALARH